jgi:hypothetical protein
MTPALVGLDGPTQLRTKFLIESNLRKLFNPIKIIQNLPNSWLLNAEASCEFGLRDVATPKCGADITDDLPSQNRLSALLCSVAAVVFIVACIQVFWVHAPSTMFHGAAMKNQWFAFGYRADMQNVRRGVRPDIGRKFIRFAKTSADNSMPLTGAIAVLAGIVSCSRPQPASVWMRVFGHFRPKALWEVCRQSLRSKILRSNFDLHNFSRLILCHAPGLPTAGAFSFCLSGSNLQGVCGA